MFQVKNKLSGAMVDVVATKIQIVNGKEVLYFVVYGETEHAWIQRPANDYEGENAETQDPKIIAVSTYDQFITALQSPGATINLMADIDLSGSLTATGETHIIGNGHVLTISSEEGKDGLIFTASECSIENVTISYQDLDDGWGGHYCLQAYNCQAVHIKDCIFKGADAAILVNGSIVTLEGTNDVSGNGFGGIEVSSGSSTPAYTSTLHNNGTLVNTTEAYKLPTVWTDGPGIVESTQTLYSANINNQVQYYLEEANTTDQPAESVEPEE